MATKNLTATNAATRPATLVSAPPPPDFTEDRKHCESLNSKVGPRSVVSATGDSLKTVARAQSNALHDVTALLDALPAGLERLDAKEDIDPLFRLAQMAKVKVAGTICAFDLHI